MPFYKFMNALKVLVPLIIVLTILFQPLFKQYVKQYDHPIYRATSTIQITQTSEKQIEFNQLRQVLFDDEDFLLKLAKQLNLSGTKSEKKIAITSGLQFVPTDKKEKLARLVVDDYSKEKVRVKAQALTKALIHTELEYEAIKLEIKHDVTVQKQPVNRKILGYYISIPIFSCLMANALATVVSMVGLYFWNHNQLSKQSSKGTTVCSTS
jgi:hypothetical protein